MFKNLPRALPVLVLVTVLCGAASGCRARAARVMLGPTAAETAAEAGAVRSAAGSALRAAEAAAAGSTRGYFLAGLALLVLGGLAVILGAKGIGAAAMALGCAVSGMGVLIAHYPWIVLLVFLAAAAVAALAPFDRWRKARALEKNRAALAAAAQVIQNLPEGAAIKQGLAGLGGEIAAQVREVVTPIKEQLRKEGKIPA